MIDILSFGGGVQSWGIAALVKRGALPAPDFAVMVDTGREVASTWRYLEKHRDDLPFPLVVVRQPLPDIFYPSGQRDCLLPAFFKGGKLPVFCSGEWKRDVFRRYLRRELHVKSARIILGISYDEAERMTNATPQWLQNSYPLVEHRITRAACQRAALDVFGELPSRSRCWCCPNQNRADWLSLPDGELQRAAEIDAQIRASGLFLHRSRLPLLDGYALDEAQGELFGGDCDGGYCYV